MSGFDAELLMFDQFNRSGALGTSAMATSTVQSIKLAIVSTTGLSKDALHIYVGLAVFLAVALVSKRGIASWRAWLAVLLTAMCGELLDMRDDLAGLGSWRWRASLHDVVNTCSWPSILLVVARWRASVLTGTKASTSSARTGLDLS